jgi:RNA polymerase sigma-70 factor (ECF subfamily)
MRRVDLTEQEQEAVATLREGDVHGLETLVRLHQLQAVRTAYAITGSRHAAEDVVADAFLRVYERIHQYDSRRPFTPWFYRIVVNGSLKAVRNSRRTRSSDDLDMEWLKEQASESPGPEEEAATREMRLLLLSAIYTLPPHQRAVVVLRYYLDMDEATMAQTLGCPLGTVKWRLHAARQRLRRTLTPELG